MGKSQAKFAHLAGDGQCIAQAKSTGKRCKNTPVKGKDVCKYHGGHSPSGPEHGRWKHGRYSKHLPSKLATKFEESLNDPELLKLDSEIALVQTRMAMLMERLDVAESERAYKRIKGLASAIMKAGTLETAKSKASDILDVVEGREGDYDLWAEIGELQERRRRLAESERKHIREQEQFITDTQLAALMGAVLVIIRENVTDRSTRRQISDGIDRLIAEDA